MPNKSKKTTAWAKYRKRYRKEWETQPELKAWIQPVVGDDSKAMCKFCKCGVRAHFGDLVKHASTGKHKKSSQPCSSMRLTDLGVSFTKRSFAGCIMAVTGRRIYLDYNATTPLDPTVVRTITDSLANDWANPSSAYPEGTEVKNVIATARKQTADAIGAEEKDIIFTSGGTEANNWVIRTAIDHFYKANSLSGTGDSKTRAHIVSTAVEHDSVSLPLIHSQSRGEIDVTFVAINDDHGYVTPQDVVKAIRPSTCLVSVMMANNETGTIMPVGEISKLVKEQNPSILIHTDAAQAIGKVPVDVRKLGIDYLTIVGHKIYGPRIGALYIRNLQQKDGAPLYSLLHGGGQERNLRPGTENTPMIAGLGRAVAIANENVDIFAENMRRTRDHLEKRLKEEFVDLVVFNCTKAPRLPNTCSVSFTGENLEGYRLVKKISGFSCSTGSACHANECKPSQILMHFNVPFKIAANTLRISTGRETTIDDIEKVVAELKLLIPRPVK